MTKKQKADETAFTQRMLMSVVVDVACLAENVERVKTQIYALAIENGVAIPKPERD